MNAKLMFIAAGRLRDVPVGAMAQQSRCSSGWRDPSAQTTPQAAPAANETVDRTLGELIDEAERARATDRGFRDSFDSFVLVNRGCEYTARSVPVYGG